MKLSRWQRFRKIEQELKKNTRVTGELEDLCICSNERFEQIVCNKMNISSGHYYEFLFSCMLFSTLGEQFKKSDIRSDIADHYDAKICGMACDFTMILSQRVKKPRSGIVLIRFPHKSYHKGTRVKKEIIDIVLDTVREHGIQITPDDDRLSELKERISKYAY